MADEGYSRGRGGYGRSDSIFDNDRDRARGRDGGGFLERAGETVQSWIGGGDDDGRTGSRDSRGYGRDSEQNSGFFGRDVGYGGGSGGGWGAPAYGGFEDRNRGGSTDHFAGRGGGYGDGGGQYQRGRFGGGAGNFGRRDHPQSVGEANQSMDDSWTTTRDTNRSGSGLSSRGGRDHFDDHYHSWRDQQVQQFDRDYEEYRREQQQQFHSAFDSWRQRKRQGAASSSSETGTTAGSEDGATETAGTTRTTRTL